MKKLLSISLLLFAVNILSAQVDTVISYTGDTLIGSVITKLDKYLIKDNSLIKFKESNGKNRAITPKEYKKLISKPKVITYTGKYLSVFVQGNNYRFGSVIIEDKLCLLEVGLMQKNRMQKYSGYKKQYVLLIDGKKGLPINSPKMKYYEYFADYPDIVDGIKNETYLLDKVSIKQLVKHFNSTY